MAYKWYFNEHIPGYKIREPIQGEFFATEAISNPGEALIREGIQNSLDARAENDSVLVRIFVSGQDNAAKQEDVEPFMKDIWDHVYAEKNGLRNAPEHIESCPYLVFEDFGTTGLLGDPAQAAPKDDTKNDFFNFFRAEGRSDKSEKDLGRWGVGKTVFPRSSRINSYFGLTVRENDMKPMLMGQSVLKSHYVDGQYYMGDGWYGTAPDDIANNLIMPINDPDMIDLFSKTFNLMRKGDPGLSIVVPWYDLELTDDNLIKAILRYYFWPILKGNLSIIVEIPGIKTDLDSQNLSKTLGKVGGELESEVRPLIELAEWAIKLEEKDIIHLRAQPRDKALNWSEALFPTDILDALRKRYERNERLALHVPVVIEGKGKDPEESYFHVYLEKDEDEKEKRPVYIREGIIIPDNKPPKTHGVRSIVVAEDKAIATFLGDSENPAHTQWQKDSTNFREKYNRGWSGLQFIIKSVSEIVRILSDSGEMVEKNLLIDIFSLPSSDEDSLQVLGQKESTRNGEKPGGEQDKNRKQRRIQFRIDKARGGFIVRAGEDNKQIPELLDIRVAYQVRRGDPFKKYRPADFEVNKDPIHIELNGSELITAEENCIRVRILEEGFRIRVKGFDENRDLRVEVSAREMEDGTEDD